MELVHGPRARGYGWRNNGRLWVGYVFPPVIDSHLVGLSRAALKHELRGRYDLALPNADLGQLTTDGANLWGSARLLQRYAAETGDALVLEFDLGEATSTHLSAGRSSSTPTTGQNKYSRNPHREQLSTPRFYCLSRLTVRRRDRPHGPGLRNRQF